MLKIEFKVTTSRKHKCYGCKKELRGEDGFIRIMHTPSNWEKIGNDIKICPDCFDEFMKKVHERRKTSVKDYKNLLRKRMLWGLK